MQHEYTSILKQREAVDNTTYLEFCSTKSHNAFTFTRKQIDHPIRAYFTYIRSERMYLQKERVATREVDKRFVVKRVSFARTGNES